MIVDPLHFIVVPLTISLLALLMLGTLYDITTFRRRKNKIESVYRCRHCHHIYTERHRTPLARCPKCNHQNEPTRK